LADNLQMRKKQTEIEEIGGHIKKEEDRLGGLDVENLARERSRLQKQRDDLDDEVTRQFILAFVLCK
jgi:hypothetical protein